MSFTQNLKNTNYRDVPNNSICVKWNNQETYIPQGLTPTILIDLHFLSQDYSACISEMNGIKVHFRLNDNDSDNDIELGSAFIKFEEIADFLKVEFENVHNKFKQFNLFVNESNKNKHLLSTAHLGGGNVENNDFAAYGVESYINMILAESLYIDMDLNVLFDLMLKFYFEQFLNADFESLIGARLQIMDNYWRYNNWSV